MHSFSLSFSFLCCTCSLCYMQKVLLSKRLQPLYTSASRRESDERCHRSWQVVLRIMLLDKWHFFKFHFHLFFSRHDMKGSYIKKRQYSIYSEQKRSYSLSLCLCWGFFSYRCPRTFNIEKNGKSKHEFGHRDTLKPQK